MQKRCLKRPKLLHHAFERLAQQQPNALAIIAPKCKITYSQLSSLSNSIAQTLIPKGASRNTLVAIVMEKGWEQVAATLGVLKSGAAYLPIDSNETSARIHHLLKTGNVSILLTQSHLETKKWPSDVQVVVIGTEKLQDSRSSELSTVNRQTENDLAYVIFTSGSTGTPKGVMISHKAVINTIEDINKRFEIKANDRIFALSALNFDLSVYDIFGPLSVGATIIVPDQNSLKDPVYWVKVLQNEKITIWNSVPAIFQMLTEYVANQTQKFKSEKFKHCLRLVLLSGDWIPVFLPEKIFNIFGSLELISLGGATEASIWSILYPIKKVEPCWKSIPYGKAMRNQAFYVLDKDLSLQSIGVAGELFIGGMGVAQGYWQDPERTKSHFITHPLSREKLYRTGDLGRYLPDGNIEFLGRVDQQVKIRGFRVDLGAIEYCLLKHYSIKQAAVVAAGQDHNIKLVACIVPKKSLTEETKTQLSTDRVEHWHKLYDQVYLRQEHDDQLFNISGWNDTYTSKPIPQDQMKEWLNNSVKRICALKPKKVLEIGCGTGLILFKVAPLVSYYHATDLSESAISYVKNSLTNMHNVNVTLERKEAIDFSSHYDDAFDTIIINSVAQYFPSIEYFEQVVNGAINASTTNGCIFVGDIRSLEYLQPFHLSVLLHNSDDDQTFSNQMVSLMNRTEQEDELCISHQYFYQLKKKNKRISHVKILLKEGTHENELNRFRYDAILYLDSCQEKNKKQPEFVSLDWFTQSLDTKKIQHALKTKKPKLLAVNNIPSRFLAGLGQEFKANNETISRIHKLILIKRLSSIPPAKLYKLAVDNGYQLLLTPCHDSNELMNAIFYKMAFEKEACNLMETISSKSDASLSLYNLPLLPKLKQIFIKNLKSYLQPLLPEYMMPSVFSILDELPMSQNGKVDRQLIAQYHSITLRKYAPPKTILQHYLANLWSSLMHESMIGIDDNFFEIGGNSLLLVNVLTQLNKRFNLELSLHDLEQTLPTIRSLSRNLEPMIASSTTDASLETL